MMLPPPQASLVHLEGVDYKLEADDQSEPPHWHVWMTDPRNEELTRIHRASSTSLAPSGRPATRNALQRGNTSTRACSPSVPSSARSPKTPPRTKSKWSAMLFDSQLILVFRDFVPFRNSKLTKLLQPSLSGNARISVICTLNPTPTSVSESTSTLQFASRVKKVQVRTFVPAMYFHI